MFVYFFFKPYVLYCEPLAVSRDTPGGPDTFREPLL